MRVHSTLKGVLFHGNVLHLAPFYEDEKPKNACDKTASIRYKTVFRMQAETDLLAPMN